MSDNVSRVVVEPAEKYHADKEHIGSSSLAEGQLSMKHFHAAWKGAELEPTDAMVKGTVLHSLLLEQDVERFVPRPIKDGRLVASNTKEYAAFLAANPGKTPIHPDQYSELYAALTAFTENKTAMRMLENSRIENSVYAVDHETGLKIKARPDIWGSNYIVDLKTITGRIGNDFPKKIFTNSFDLRLSHYGETIFSATGELITDYYIIAFEQKPPFAMRIFRIPLVHMNEAKARRRFLLNEIAVSLEENCFRGYGEDIVEAIRPKYLEIETEVLFEGAG